MDVGRFVTRTNREAVALGRNGRKALLRLVSRRTARVGRVLAALKLGQKPAVGPRGQGVCGCGRGFTRRRHHLNCRRNPRTWGKLNRALSRIAPEIAQQFFRPNPFAARLLGDAGKGAASGGKPCF